MDGAGRSKRGALDTISLGFLVLVVLMGGAIAYFADRLGRVLGKKRLSIFGLRPRHTAGLLTVAAGILIPFLTVLLLMGVSKDFRQWVEEGRKALRQVVEYQKSSAELRDKNNALELQNDTLEAQIEGQEGALGKIQQELDRSGKELRSLREERGALQAQADKAAARIAALNAQMEGVQSEYTVTLAKLREAEGSFKETEERLQGLRGSYAQLDEQHQELNRQNLTLIQENALYESKIEELQAQLSKLQTERTTLGLQVEKAREEAEAIQIRLDGMKGELADKQEELNRVLVRYSRLMGSTETFRFSPVVFRVNEEVARVFVSSQQTDEEARQTLSRLLRAARTEALSRNAADAILVEREEANTGRVVTPGEQEEAIVKATVGIDEPLVLVAYSSLNTVVGEPVGLHILSYRNPLVYRAGEVIAQQRIDGSKDLAEIVADISDLLLIQVRTRAQKDRMIPQGGEEESFGSLSTAEMLDVAERVRVRGRPVKVSAIVRSDTRAGDPLYLRFRVD